jgi:hypothetical protein
MVWCGWLLCRQLDDPARAPKSPLSDNTRFHRGNANGRKRRILVVAGRPGEGPFTIRFADLRRDVTRTATQVLASRPEGKMDRGEITKQARVAAWLSKSLAEPGKVRSTSHMKAL